MLIALTKGQTCQTLSFLDISEQHVQRNEECFYFALTEHLKQDRQNFWQCRPLQVSSICVLLKGVKLFFFPNFVWAPSHFLLTALKSHDNPDVRNDFVELKIIRDLPVS